MDTSSTSTLFHDSILVYLIRYFLLLFVCQICHEIKNYQNLFYQIPISSRYIIISSPYPEVRCRVLNVCHSLKGSEIQTFVGSCNWNDNKAEVTSSNKRTFDYFLTQKSLEDLFKVSGTKEHQPEARGGGPMLINICLKVLLRLCCKYAPIWDLEMSLTLQIIEKMM